MACTTYIYVVVHRRESWYIRRGTSLVSLYDSRRAERLINDSYNFSVCAPPSSKALALARRALSFSIIIYIYIQI